MTIPPSQKMTIPRSLSDDIFAGVTTIVGFVIGLIFVMLALVNLFSGAALIASSLWLALVTIWNWSACREAGGFRRFLINRVGDLAGRRFVEVDPADVQPRNVHFGFELLGHCYIQQSIPIDRIESVNWSMGQASSMAGCDRNDWGVWVRFAHNDPTKNAKKRSFKNPEHDIYGVGPYARKGLTEALGLSLVAFLRDAGADLIQGDSASRFVKRRDAGEKQGDANCECAGYV